MARSSNKEVILKEAFKLFLSKGFDAVSFSDLVKATGISRGGMFHHFKGKEDIFNQVADRFVFDFFKQNERLHKDIDSATPLEYFLKECVEEVEARMKYFIESFEGSITSASFMSFTLYLKEHYPSWNEKLQEYEKQEVSMWRKVVKQAKEKGEIQNDIEEELIIATFRILYLGLSYKGAMIDRLSIKELRDLWWGIYQQVVS